MLASVRHERGKLGNVVIPSAHLANGAPAALKLSIPDAHSHRERGYGRRISDSYAGSVNEGAPKKANPAVSLLVFPSAILRTDQVYRLDAYFLLYKKRFFGDVDSPSHASIVHGFKVDSPCFYWVRDSLTFRQFSANPANRRQTPSRARHSSRAC